MRLANVRSRFIFKQKQNHYSAFPSWDTRLTRFEQVAAVVAAETDAKLSDFVPRPSRGNLRACCSKGLGELVEGVTTFQAVSSSHFSKLLNQFCQLYFLFFDVLIFNEYCQDLKFLFPSQFSHLQIRQKRRPVEFPLKLQFPNGLQMFMHL